MKTLLFGLIAFGLITMGGCRKSDREKEMEEAAEKMKEKSEELAEAAEEMEEEMEESVEDIEEAMEKMQKALGGGKKVEPVSFRVLKEMLPESLPGMERTAASGEKNAAFGVKVSEAHGKYSSEDGGTIEIKITDMGSVSGLVGMARYAWAQSEFERESEDGYEKTTTFEGYKAIEKYTISTRKGELQILIGKRFVVDVDGRGVEMNQVLEAASTIDLDELESMKDSGTTS
ncbi:MAG: hypothetical protein WBG01_11100 [Bacteroidota bacterium]